MHDANSILKKYWGYKQFRSLQAEVVESVLSRRDTLAILPTGGGKSLCYQVPAMAVEGLTIVVSPVLALIDDQVRALVNRQVPAAFITSALSMDQVLAVLRGVENGDVKLLYVAPERLVSPLFTARLRSVPVGIIAVDEAHCISEWGDVFRPSYRSIANFRDSICPGSVTIAVTATATPRVARDIRQSLRLVSPSEFRTTVDRPNIYWRVQPSINKRETLMTLLPRVNGSKIVYAGTRRSVVRLREWLGRRGIAAFQYHGGMDAEARASSLSSWLSLDDATMVATNAFGMGIDKDNVRLVVHVALPRTIEGYYQEGGRAGRDGQASGAILMYNKADVDRQKQLLQYGAANPAASRRLVKYLRKMSRTAAGHDNWYVVQKAAIDGELKIDSVLADGLLSTLHRKKIIQLIEHENKYVLQIRKPDQMMRFPAILRQYRRRTHKQSRDIVNYLNTATCRRRYLLNYFGEESTSSCNSCSICDSSERQSGQSASLSPLLANSL